MAKDNSKITSTDMNRAGADKGALNAMGAYSIVNFKEQSDFIKMTENNLLKSFTELYRQRTKLALDSYGKEYRLRLNFENEILKRQIGSFKLQNQNLDKQQQKQLRNLEQLAKSQFDTTKQLSKLDDDLNDKRNKELDKFSSKLQSIFKSVMDVASFIPYYHTLTTSYGKLDIKGSMQKGAQSAYDFRGQYGMFGKETLEALANTITSSYKDMKSKGIVIDPAIMRDQLQQLKNIVNVNTTNTAQLQSLITASAQVKAMGGSMDTTTLGTQSLNQMYGGKLASDIQATILTTLQDTYTNLSEATIAKFYNDNMFTARVMSEFKSDEAIKNFYADLTQSFGGVSDVLGSAGASIMSDALLKYFGASGTDITKLARFAAQSGIAVDFTDTDALLRDLPKLTSGLYEVSQQFAGMNLDSPEIASLVVEQLGGSMSVDQLKMLQALGESYGDKYNGGEALTGDEFEALIAVQTNKDNATQAQIDAYKQLISDKYTKIDKDNLELQMAAWESSTDYQNVTQEQLSTIIGYVDQILPSINSITKAVWGSGLLQTGSSILKPGIDKLLANVVGSGMAVAPSAGAASGSALASLGATGPIALGVIAAVGMTTAAVVGGIKSIQETRDETFGAINTSLSNIENYINPEGSATYSGFKKQVTYNEGKREEEWVQQDVATQAEANASIEDKYSEDVGSNFFQKADTYAGNKLPFWVQALLNLSPALRPVLYGLGIASGATSTRDKKLYEEYNKWLSENNTQNAQDAYSFYYDNEIIGDVSNRKLRKNTDAFFKNYADIERLYNQGLYVKLDEMRKVSDQTDSHGVPLWDSNYDRLKSISSPLTDFEEYAFGLSSVPYDGKRAILHQGEMVLPAKQANYIRALFGQKPVSASGGAFADKLTGNNSFVQSIPKYTQGGPMEGTIGYYAAGDDAVSFAYKNIGTPYSSMDCSDMVSQAYRTGAGLGVSDQTAGGIGEYWPGQGFSTLYRGNKLSKEDLGKFNLKPGDVLLYKLGNGRAGRYMDISHASLYVNPTTQIHSTPKQGGVKTSGLWNQVVSILRYGAGGESNGDFSNIDSTYIEPGLFGGGLRGGFDVTGLAPFMHIPMIAEFVRKYGQYLGISSSSGVSYQDGVIDYVSDNKSYGSNMYSPLLRKYAGIPGVDPRLLYGMMMTESSGNPDANMDKSTKYKGLMQMSQGSVNEYLGLGHNVFDPETNIKASAYHLARAIKKVRYNSLGIGGYNAGWNYKGWQTARGILDNGGDWVDILSQMNDVGSRDELMKGNPNNIKTSYINSVYKNAQIPLRIPYLEDGGIVGTDGIYRLAEKNRTEAVIPLENNKDSLGIGTLGDDLLDGMDSATGHLVNKLDNMIGLLKKLCQNNANYSSSTVNNQRDSWHASVNSFNGVK